MAEAKLSLWIAVLGKNEKVLTERVRCVLTHDEGGRFTNRERINLLTTGRGARATQFGFYLSEDAEFPTWVGPLRLPVMLNNIASGSPCMQIVADRVEFAPGAMELHLG